MINKIQNEDQYKTQVYGVRQTCGSTVYVALPSLCNILYLIKVPFPNVMF